MTTPLLRGVERGISFFRWVGTVGYYFLIGLCMVTTFVFWIGVTIYLADVPGVTSIGITVLKTLQIALLCCIVGWILMMFLEQVYNFLFNREMKKIQIESCPPLIDDKSHGKRRSAKKATSTA